MTIPRLEGERVLLRPIDPMDRDALTAILAEPGVAPWWVHESLEAAVAGIYDDDPDEVRFTIEVDGEVAGFIQYGEELTPDYKHAGIDLFLGAAWQGRGLGPEAIRVLARYLIQVRGHHRITIDPALANERAIRAYEKIGFRRVGVMRRYERGSDGIWRDGLLLDLLAEELRD